MRDEEQKKLIKATSMEDEIQSALRSLGPQADLIALAERSQRAMDDLMGQIRVPEELLKSIQANLRGLLPLDFSEGTRHDLGDRAVATVDGQRAQG
jgi:hypothetical protein